MLISTSRALRVAHAMRQRGFTITELLVTFALFGLLVALGLPSFQSWVRNNQMRSVADALQNGLRLAQSEAVRRNQAVVFAFTNTVPTATSASAAAAGGKNWEIWTIDQFASTTAAFIEGGALASVASPVTITAVSGQAAVCFNANGRLIANTSTGVGSNCAAGPQILKLAQPTTLTDDRQLRVTVSVAGQVRMCDLSLGTQSATVPGGCPAGTP